MRGVGILNIVSDEVGDFKKHFSDKFGIPKRKESLQRVKLSGTFAFAFAPYVYIIVRSISNNIMIEYNLYN